MCHSDDPIPGCNSPASILSQWLVAREDFTKKKKGKHEPLFCTVAGTQKNIGNRVSADSLRKAIYANFPGNTATHSLRKGGARFYASSEAPEQATHDQGGWRTSETMKQICTALSPAEVKVALHKAANAAGIAFTSQSLASALSYSGETTKDIEAAITFVNLATSVIDNVPWKKLVELKLGVHLKKLTQHGDEKVRTAAVSSWGHLRQCWAAYKAASREE